MELVFCFAFVWGSLLQDFKSYQSHNSKRLEDMPFLSWNPKLKSQIDTGKYDVENLKR